MKKAVCFVVCLIALVWIGAKPSSASKTHHMQKVVRAKEVTLLDLLFHNPARAVSEKFATKVASGEIAQMNAVIPGLSAAFMLWPVEKRSSKSVSEMSWKPVLVTDSTVIADRTQLVRNQLVLFHEYIHYCQAMSGKIPAEAFYPRFPEEHPDQREFICEQKWYAEVGAYQKECELAKLMKTSVVDDVCEDFGTSKFQHTLTKHLMSHDPSGSLCKDVFTKMIAKLVQ